MEAPPSTPKSPSAAPAATAGRDALLVFLGLSTVLLLTLLLIVRVRPSWFGGGAPPSEERPPGGSGSRLDPAGPSDDALRPLTGFAPRPSLEESGPRAQEGEAVPPRGYRAPTARRASPPTLAQAVFADTLPSVVHVTTLATDRGDVPTPTLPIIGDLTRWLSGTGSGLVWDYEGHVVTCKHVIDNIDGATVLLSDGSQWSAKFVGIDPVVDLAIVRIAASPDRLTPIRLGTSLDLQVGMHVFSVSSPYGLGSSLSAGTISGLARRVATTSGGLLENAIQTDASIHRGSSGGALVDDQARVIGLSTAVLSDSDRAAGVGFAIPIDEVLARVPEIIRSGYRWYPSVGLVVTSDEISAVRLAGIPPELGVPPRGLVVAQVDIDSPAERAGLRGMQQFEADSGGAQVAVRDIVVAVGGVEAQGREDLDRALLALAEGEPLRLRIARRDGDIDVEIVPQGR